METIKIDTVMTLIPKLRFDSNEWYEITLGDHVKIKSGISPSSYELTDKGQFPFIKVEELNNCNKYQNQSRFYSNDDKNLIEKFSVIFPKRGAAILNNKVRINDCPILMDSNMMALIPEKVRLDSEFLYYKIVKEELYKIADTSTIPQINNKHIEPYKFFIPSLPEQQKIASFLSAVDEKIQLLARKKELLENYKKGTMQQLFSGKLRFKDADGKDFPEWEEKRFKDIYTFYSTNSLSREKLNYEGGSVKNIHYGDIHTKFKSHFDFKNELVPFINSDVDLSKIKNDNYCQEGDLVIADASEDYADIGKSIEIINIQNEKVVAGLHTLLARPNKGEMYVGFSGHLLKSANFRKQLMIIAQGSKVLSISTGRVGLIKINLPTYNEQQKIATFLSAIDDKIEAVNKQITQSQTFKKGLLQQLFV